MNSPAIGRASFAWSAGIAVWLLVALEGTCVTVLTSDPDAHAHNATANTNVTLDFDANIDAGTVDASSVIVHGAFSGKRPGSFAVTGSEVIFDPATEFLVGERVQITVTDGVEDTGATPSDRRVIQFRAGTSGGTGYFTDSGQNLDPLFTFDLELGDLDGDGDLDAFATTFDQSGNVVLENTGLHSGSFQNRATLGTQDNQAAVLADFDGDGDLDAFVASDSFGNRIWFNDGAFSFSDGGMIPVAAGLTRSVDAGDLDGDGDMDVFLGNLNDENQVWLNDGTGAFTDLAQAAFAAVEEMSRGVALGDLDGDGDLDAYVANTNQFNRIWINDGAGVFSAGQVQDQLMRVSWGVELGDLDGDGDLDAVVANQGDHTVWQNDGTGTFADVASLPMGSGQDVRLGDVDADGDLDAVFASTAMVGRVYLNDGTGTFTDSFQPFEDHPDAADMAHATLGLGDLNGDGALDIYFGNGFNQLGDRVWFNGAIFTVSDVGVTKTSGVSAVFEGATLTYTISVTNTGPDGVTGVTVTDQFPAGTTERTLVNVTTSGGAAASATPGAIAGDLVDTVDLPVGSQVDYEVTVRVPAGCNGVPASSILTNSVSVTLPAGALDSDFDNNEDDDSLLVLPAPPGVFGTGGSGIFLDSGQPALGEGLAVALGDLDGTGSLDAFLAGGGAGDRVLLNDGSAIFTEKTQTLGMGNSRDVELGDLDCDGDLDAFIANWVTVDGSTVNPGPNEVWLNDDGLGTFMNSNQSLGDAASWAVSLGDVDGDGDLDAFIANYKMPNPPNPFLPANKVWLNDGTGNFSDSGQFLGNSDSYDVQLGDLDGDGDLDAFVANFDTVGPDANKVWMNDGMGNFSDSGQTLGNSNSYGISLGDLDGDGDLDAFVTNFFQPETVWMNDGTGTFNELAQATSLGTDPGSRVKLGDLDGDGDLDAFVTNFGAADRIWFNDGAGQFNAGGMLGANSSFGLGLGDLDGDGDVDAFAANFSSEDVLVWLNQNPIASMGMSPDDGADGTSIFAALSLVFDRRMEAGAGRITIRRLSDGTLFESIAAGSGRVTYDHDPSGTTVSIHPVSPFTLDTEFYVEVDPDAFQTPAGVPFVGIQGPDAWNFATSPIVVTDATRAGTEFTIRFTSEAFLSGWRVMGSRTLLSFSEDRTGDSTVTEPVPGEYEAVINLGVLLDRYFLRIEH